MKNLSNAPETAAELLTIGALAKRVGFAVSALRYYEEVGLIPPALRRESGHRVYPESVLDVLILIRHCRDLGFSIDETRELVALSTNGERDCVEARAIAQTHLTAAGRRPATQHVLLPMPSEPARRPAKRLGGQDSYCL